VICSLAPTLPPGIIVEQVLPGADRIVLVARPMAGSAPCPFCDMPSSRVHSHYQRCLADLPWHGRIVEIQLRVRRLRCSNAACPYGIFAERLPAVMLSRVRRTTRLRTSQQQIALTAGGEPGSRLARRLAMPVSGDTLLRLIRAAEVEPPKPPRVIGIDDWAFRRGQSYGTIVCDLERRRVIDLLPDRSAGTVARWLKEHPGVEMVARDRAGGYAEGARSGAPQADQVADRWHLLRNLGEVLQGIVDRHRRPISDAAAAVAHDHHEERRREARPVLSTEQELRQARRQRRQERFEAMQHLKRLGLSTVQIGATLGVSSLTVQRWLRAGVPPSHNKPPQLGNLGAHGADLDRRWQEGCRNATRLWRELRDRGYRGGERTVRRWAARRRSGAIRHEDADVVAATGWRLPSSRRCARLLASPADQLDPSERVFLSHLRASALDLVRAGELALAFATMLRTRHPQAEAAGAFETWLDQARDSLLGGFARGLKRDRLAVEAALAERWSTSPVEGHINRLKTLKRTMYGRAGLDLLRQRMLLVA